MAKPYYPREDAAFLTYTQNADSVLENNLTEFGISQDKYDKFHTNVSAYGTKLAAHVATQAAAKGATDEKNLSKRELLVSLREIVNIVSANLDAPNYLKEEAGFPVHDKIPTDLIPYLPVNLTVKGYADGTNESNWDKGENKPGCLYVIEAMIGDATEFSVVDTITATKYAHKNQKPGVRAIYRVRAKRKNLISDPSNEAAVYSD